MFFSHLFLLLSGGMLTVTFNVTSFMYMGAIMGLFKMAEAQKPKPLFYERELAGDSTPTAMTARRMKPYFFKTKSTKVFP